MAENESQGITRRDLLRRGAVLGGAVVWATPVVQTLGMGRAFAQVPSPPVDGGDKAVSYVVISWTCDGEDLKVKWENGSFSTSGALPDCGGVPGGYADSVPSGLAVTLSSNPTCVLVDVPDVDGFGCESVSNVTAWVKAGSSQSSLEPCNPTSLNVNESNQQACSS